MVRAYLKFTKETRYSSDSMSRIQVNCINLVTREKVRLMFTKGSKLFRRVCNIPHGGGEFTLYVKYNEYWKDNVQEIKGEELQEFYLNNAEFCV